MKTIDEVIQNVKKEAENNRKQIDRLNKRIKELKTQKELDWDSIFSNHESISEYTERAKDCEQLAKWLEEYKANNHLKCSECAGCTSWKCDCSNVRNKAIDDFVEQLKNSLMNNYRHLSTKDTDGFDWLTTDAVNTHIDEVAKQLKEGSANNE